MKFLLFSDFHFHMYKEFSTDIDGLNSRFADQLAVMRTIINQVEERKPDFALFLGDLLQLKNYPDTQVIQLVIDAMSELAAHVPILMISGNHDYKAWDSHPSILEVLSSRVKNIQLLPTGAYKELGLVASSYSRDYEKVNEFIRDCPEEKIFIGHHDMIGASYYGHVVEKGADPELLSKKFRWSFLGHWHKSKKFKDNVISVGGPLEFNFGDMGEQKGWWFFDSAKDELKFIENSFSPQFRELVLTGDEEELVSDQKNFYRIKIRTNQQIKGLDTLKFKRVSYDYQGKRKDRVSLSFSDKKGDILAKYISARGQDSGLDSSKLLEIGARYI